MAGVQGERASQAKGSLAVATAGANWFSMHQESNMQSDCHCCICRPKDRGASHAQPCAARPCSAWAARRAMRPCAAAGLRAAQRSCRKPACSHAASRLAAATPSNRHLTLPRPRTPFSRPPARPLAPAHPPLPHPPTIIARSPTRPCALTLRCRRPLLPAPAAGTRAPRSWAAEPVRLPVTGGGT